MELMVAMAITSIIVVALVSITSMALDTWNRSRSELRASRQAKTMIEAMSKDFEALVVRQGNLNEWLFAEVESTMPGDKLPSTNAAQLVFFSAATDRYNGKIGSADDLGGDVCGIAYELKFRDAFDASKTSGVTNSYIFNRFLIDPKDAFENLLGKTNLETAFEPVKNSMNEENYFVCENIFQFSMTFHVEVTKTDASGNRETFHVPVVLQDGGASEFHVKGNEILATGASLPSGVTVDDLKTGRLTAVEVSLTVFSDHLVAITNRREPTEKERLQGSFQYSKVIQVPTS